MVDVLPVPQEYSAAQHSPFYAQNTPFDGASSSTSSHSDQEREINDLHQPSQGQIYDLLNQVFSVVLKQEDQLAQMQAKLDQFMQGTTGFNSEKITQVETSPVYPGIETS